MSMLEIVEFEKRLREADHQDIEAYRKGTAPAPLLYKARAGAVKPIEEGRPMVFLASDAGEDRYGDVIDVDGWDLAAYQANPVFMFIHQLDVAPIGTMPRVWVEEEELLAMPRWDDADPLAAFIKGKYERGVMKAVSVGFRPVEVEERSTKKGVGYHFKLQELLEISAVPVPAHPRALQKAMGTRKFGIVVPEITPVTVVSVHGSSAEVVNGFSNVTVGSASLGILPSLEQTRAGAVLNKADRDKLSQAHQLLADVLATETVERTPAIPETPATPEDPEPPQASDGLEAVLQTLRNVNAAFTKEA